MTNRNPILSTDSYKFSHDKQYPEGTEDIYAYLSARGSRVAGCNEVVMFGLQPWIHDRMCTPVTRKHVDDARMFCIAHGVPFNYEGWKYIVEKHNGFLPVEIRAVPEGTVVPVGMPMVTVHATDPKCAWLTCYLETDIMRAVWYGSTVATISRHCKKIIKRYLDITADNPEQEISFKLHDFGFRGVSSTESAEIGGAAHLINFMGTDTVGGITHAMEYYAADVCGFSIPASEHSTMTSWGRDNEIKAYWNMLEQYAGQGKTFAMVIDSYNWREAVEKLYNSGFFDEVKARGATVVLRPDSGDPTKVPVELIGQLMLLLGYDRNGKGYKVLPSHVRVIQGDGITFESLEQILIKMVHHGFSTSNIAFGMGAGLLQKCDRDTFKFAMKCSAIQHFNGFWSDVFKDPIDAPDKKSLRGRVTTIKHVDGTMSVTTLDKLREEHRIQMTEEGDMNMLNVVYVLDHNGMRVKFTNFEAIRARAAV
jgi:nicotinamide phosphoribosyltransferase